MKAKQAEEIRRCISIDIEEGVYDRWPKLKKRLLIITQKIMESQIIINGTSDLSWYDIEVLKENDYLDKYYIHK